MRFRFVAVLALAAFVASCGGDGEAATAEALAESLQANAPADSPFTAEASLCFGTAVVERVGLDRLAELGLDQESLDAGAELGSAGLSDDDLDSFVGSLLDCVDLGRPIVDEISASVALSDGSADCLVAGINESDFLRGVAAATLGGDDADEATNELLRDVLIDLIPQCLSEDELTDLGL